MVAEAKKEMPKSGLEKRALRDLLEAGKISQVTYDHLIGGVEKEIAEIERRRNLLAYDVALKMDEVKGLVEALERHFAKIQVSHSAGEMDEDRFKREKEIHTSGIKTLMMQLGDLENTLKELRGKVVEPEKGFRKLNSFERERRAFLKIKDSLLGHETYRDKFVAVYGGKVVDVDDDIRKLAKRVYNEYGYVPIYMGKVQKEGRVVELPSPER